MVCRETCCLFKGLQLEDAPVMHPRNALHPHPRPVIAMRFFDGCTPLPVVVGDADDLLSSEPVGDLLWVGLGKFGTQFLLNGCRFCLVRTCVQVFAVSLAAECLLSFKQTVC